MDYIFDKKKLESLICDFHTSTGIAITLYDTSGEVVAKSPAFSGYCTCIRTKEACVQSCNRSDQAHMEAAAKQRTVHSYTCHAGLMETITPIIYEDVVIAYLQIGQFRDQEEIYSSREKVRTTARQYGIAEDVMLKQHEVLPVISNVKLNALLRITNILIHSFWEDSLIQRRRGMLSVKISQYITSRITEKIYIDDICKAFSISKFTLYALFKEEFHTTVNAFILEKRIALARQLLCQKENWNITQIASACGFSDYNYFIRAFKGHMGITPLKFQKEQFKDRKANQQKYLPEGMP